MGSLGKDLAIAAIAAPTTEADINSKFMLKIPIANGIFFLFIINVSIQYFYLSFIFLTPLC
jgi:hypothetical protein